MTTYEVMDYLNRYRDCCKRIVQLQEQLEGLREVEQSAKIQQLSDMPKGSARDSDLSDVLVKIENLQDKIDDKIVESLSIRLDIESLIVDLDSPEEADVLRMKYIELKPWKVIASEVNYSIQSAKRYHRSAIEKLQVKTP
jgi:hypothetical protein